MKCIIALILTIPVFAAPAGAVTLRVTEFGAIADGQSDCTAAFQRALDAAAAANGGIVEVPTGLYSFDGTLNVPMGVALRGVFQYAPSHAGIRDRSAERPEYGTVLLPRSGAGDEASAPFITLGTNSVLQGVCIHYPDQKPDAESPTPYPFAIAMRGNNPAVIDVELLNPYKAIDASQNQRHLIRNVHGQPIAMGIYVDVIYDIGRIENVHWNPWWSIGTPVYKWQTENGVGFFFGKTDWHYVHNTFCFGYNVGYKFAETEKGVCNGNFLGIGADDCFTAVHIENSSPYGILITNGEFVSFHGPDPTMVRVDETNTGTVRFVNSAFWGPCNRIAFVEGKGVIGFSDCTFFQWAHHGRDYPAIDVVGGTILVRGCEFAQDRKHVTLRRPVDRAIITENIVPFEPHIQNRAYGNVVIRDNVGVPKL
ncbi:MAG: hypothetical protein AMXMBFR84_05030 [Candidatus Hydrogenedentota bacterium]